MKDHYSNLLAYPTERLRFLPAPPACLAKAAHIPQLRYLLLLALLWLGSWPVAVQAQSVAKIDSLQGLLSRNQPDTARVRLLLQLGEQYASSAPDSALLLAKQALVLSQRINFRKGMANSLQETALAYFYRGAFKESLRYHREAFAVRQSMGDRMGVATSLRYIGNSYVTLGNMKEGLAHYQRALAIFKALRSERETAKTLANIGVVYYRESKFAQALRYQQEALRSQQILGDQAGIRDDLTNLGNTYLITGRPDKALGYYQEALAIAEKLNSRDRQTGILLNIGSIYQERGNFRQALAYYSRALALAQQLDNEVMLLYALTNMGDVYYRQKQYGPALQAYQKGLQSANATGNKEALTSVLIGLGNVNKAQRHYARSLTYFGRALTEASRVDNKANLSTISLALGQVKRQMGEPAAARAYLLRSTRLADSIGGKQLQLDAYRELASLDSARGDFRASLAAYQQYQSVKDSLLSQAKTKQLAELEARYQSGQRQKEIVTLKQQNQIQRLQVQRQRLVAAAAVGGLLLLGAVAALLYNRYRDKQRANRLLEHQKQEIEHQNQQLERTQGQLQQSLREQEFLMQELHHRTKNNLNIVRSLLLMQSRYLTDEQALEALTESSHRVEAVALIHQQLYRSGDPGQISLRNYVSALVDNLAQLVPPGQQVGITARVAALAVSIDLALPLGLIVNEVVVNSLKHAFPDGQSGAIGIELVALEKDLLLSITDTGVGLPSTAGAPDELSFRIIRGLAAQLRADCQFENAGGLRFSLTIPLPQTVAEPAA